MTTTTTTATDTPPDHLVRTGKYLGRVAWQRPPAQPSHTIQDGEWLAAPTTGTHDLYVYDNNLYRVPATDDVDPVATRAAAFTYLTTNGRTNP